MWFYISCLPSITTDNVNTDNCLRPFKFVLSADGKATQLKIWAETVEILRAEAQGADLTAL